VKDGKLLVVTHNLKREQTEIWIKIDWTLKNNSSCH
jgi:hypothetical protein